MSDNNVFSPNYGQHHQDIGELPPIVSLNNICQKYDNGETVFKDFNLSIPDIPSKGQFITIMGPSGCGKSTILRYMSSLQQPTSGTISFRSSTKAHATPPDSRSWLQKIFKSNKRRSNNSVPMVFQQYTNLEWKSVLKNVELPLNMLKINRDEAKSRAEEILKVVGLENHAKKYAKYPLLSGGQLQRVAIARGLITNPDIILMDEPFGALDVKTRQDMQIFLRRIFESQSDMTIILVTHSISEAVFLSDKIIVLGNKPAQIIQDIDIPLGDKRSETIIGTEQFKTYENMVRKALGL